MSKQAAYYFVLEQSMSRGNCTWYREYLKLTLGKTDRLEKVVELEDKTIYRPGGLRFGLPAGCVRSTKLAYTQALLRFRQDAAQRKRQLELEKEQRKLADQKLSGIRGLGPRPATPLPAAPAAPAESADLFGDFTIVDTEYQGEHLLEVAAIRYQNWQPVGKAFVSYVRFTDWVWPKVTELTGITSELVRTAPAEAKVLAGLLAYAGDSLLIAHNVAADRSKLEAARLRQRYPEPLPNRWFCTLALARARLPKGTKCGLGELVERFGFSRRGHHQALTDVQMCFQVLRHFQQQEPIQSLDPKARKAQPALFA